MIQSERQLQEQLGETRAVLRRASNRIQGTVSRLKRGTTSTHLRTDILICTEAIAACKATISMLEEHRTLVEGLEEQHIERNKHDVAYRERKKRERAAEQCGAVCTTDPVNEGTD